MRREYGGNAKESRLSERANSPVAPFGPEPSLCGPVVLVFLIGKGD